MLHSNVQTLQPSKRRRSLLDPPKRTAKGVAGMPRMLEVLGGQGFMGMLEILGDTGALWGARGGGDPRGARVLAERPCLGIAGQGACRRSVARTANLQRHEVRPKEAAACVATTHWGRGLALVTHTRASGLEGERERGIERVIVFR